MIDDFFLPVASARRWSHTRAAANAHHFLGCGEIHGIVRQTLPAQTTNRPALPRRISLARTATTAVGARTTSPTPRHDVPQNTLREKADKKIEQLQQQQKKRSDRRSPSITSSSSSSTSILLAVIGPACHQIDYRRGRRQIDYYHLGFLFSFSLISFTTCSTHDAIYIFAGT